MYPRDRYQLLAAIHRGFETDNAMEVYSYHSYTRPWHFSVVANDPYKIDQSKAPLFGVEVETDLDGDDEDLESSNPNELHNRVHIKTNTAYRSALDEGIIKMHPFQERVAQLGSFYRNYGIPTEDSTVSGIEYITHPATLGVHRMMLPALVQNLVDNGFCSGSSTGMHIHIGQYTEDSPRGVVPREAVVMGLLSMSMMRIALCRDRWYRLSLDEGQSIGEAMLACLMGAVETERMGEASVYKAPVEGSHYGHFNCRLKTLEFRAPSFLGSPALAMAQLETLNAWYRFAEDRAAKLLDGSGVDLGGAQALQTLRNRINEDARNVPAMRVGPDHNRDGWLRGMKDAGLMDGPIAYPLFPVEGRHKQWNANAAPVRARLNNTADGLYKFYLTANRSDIGSQFFAWLCSTHGWRWRHEQVYLRAVLRGMGLKLRMVGRDKDVSWMDPTAQKCLHGWRARVKEIVSCLVKQQVSFAAQAVSALDEEAA